MKINTYNNDNGYIKIKRILDIILSSILLIPCSFIILIAAICIKLETPGNAFYSQERVGLLGKKFQIYKLRSMYVDAEKNIGAIWAEKNDPRITKVGKFIRKTRIDELPQLWNILKGDMSLIGPRPERAVFIEKFKGEIPDFDNRLIVKPGISGYAQVNGGYDITPKEKYHLDMYYIENLSFMLDLKIFFKTIKIIFTGEGAR